MITLIHGDDIVSSRKYLIELKEASENAVNLNGKELNSSDLTQNLKTNSLFSEQKNIFIERLLSKGKSKDLEDIIDLLKRSSSLNITIWEDTELSKTQLSLFPKANINLFKIPKNLFSFLDNLYPNNPKSVLTFHDALKTADSETLFYMMIRQFRLLLAINSEKSGIDEIQRLASWQKDKFKRQAKMFSADQLKKIYNKLYEIDLNIKTGVYPNLTRAIDFFLLDI